jgi:phosphoserine aminotransferase
LPVEVLEQVREELLDWHGIGASVMEISHRGKTFLGIAQQAEADLRELLSIPANYKVLFLQGGATAQFAAVPLNLSVREATADYVNTGAWSKKAVAEARKYCSVNVAADAADSKYFSIPPQAKWKADPTRPTCTTHPTRPSAGSSSTGCPRQASCRWWLISPLRSSRGRSTSRDSG